MSLNYSSNIVHDVPPIGKRSVWLARYAGSPPDFERKIEFFVFVPRSGTPEAGFSKLKPMKYFIYTRKSTDSEERQILSIESQLAELREFATKEKLEIVASLCEAQTAKEPERMSVRTLFWPEADFSFS